MRLPNHVPQNLCRKPHAEAGLSVGGGMRLISIEQPSGDDGVLESRKEPTRRKRRHPTKGNPMQKKPADKLHVSFSFLS